MTNRHSAWSTSGWGYNAREPWARPRFTAERRVTERAPGGRAPLVVLGIVIALVAGFGYLYGVLSLFS